MRTYIPYQTSNTLCTSTLRAWALHTLLLRACRRLAADSRRGWLARTQRRWREATRNKIAVRRFIILSDESQRTRLLAHVYAVWVFYMHSLHAENKWCAARHAVVETAHRRLMRACTHDAWTHWRAYVTSSRCVRKFIRARDKKLCTACVQGWYVCTRGSVKHTVGEEWFVNRGVMQRVMFSWMSRVDSHHEMLGLVSSQSTESTLRRVLDEWKHFCYMKSWFVEFFQSKSSRENTDIAAKFLATWHKAARRERSVRERTRKTFGKLMGKTTGVTFATWLAAVRENKRTRQVYARAWHWKTRRLKASMFAEWVRSTAASRHVGKRTHLGMVKNSSRIEAKVLSSWRKYSATEAKLIRIWDKLCRRRAYSIRKVYFDRLVQYSDFSRLKESKCAQVLCFWQGNSLRGCVTAWACYAAAARRLRGFAVSLSECARMYVCMYVYMQICFLCSDLFL
jgi:hypothetical protein